MKSISSFQFYDKYSSVVGDRRQTYNETVDSTLSFLFNHIGLVDDHLTNELKVAMYDMTVFPSMRLFNQNPKAVIRDNSTIYNCSAFHANSWHDIASVLYLSMAGCGVGCGVEQKEVDKLPVIRPTVQGLIEYITVEDSQFGWASSFWQQLELESKGVTVHFDYTKIRPAGSILKTKNGVSSGPTVLMELHNFTKKIFDSARGRKLTVAEVSDIITFIGSVAISGGSRRSALILIGDNSEEFVNLKYNKFYLDKPWRANSNNSIAINDFVQNQDFNNLLHVFNNNVGEPGLFSRYAASKNNQRRELTHNLLTNPCVPEYTIVQTSNGPTLVEELIGKQFTAIVNGVEWESTKDGFWYTGNKNVYRLTTKSGYTVDATANHKILTTNGMIALKDISVGDSVIINKIDTSPFVVNQEFNEGWLVGEMVGDGGIVTSQTRNTYGYVKFWGHSALAMKDLSVDIINTSASNVRTVSGTYNNNVGTYTVSTVALANMALEHGITSYDKHMIANVEFAPTDFKRGFIRGLFDSDGSVQGTKDKGYSIRLSQSNIELLLTTQKLLLEFGILCTVYKDRKKAAYKLMPDGKGGNAEYYCQASHELYITKSSIAKYADAIGFYEPAKKERLDAIIADYNNGVRGAYADKYEATVTEIEYIGNMPVYDCSIPGINQFVANGIIVANCGEINLRDGQFCNLTQVNMRPNMSKSELFQAVEHATIIGTIQSMFDEFNFISPDFRNNAIEERLLGVSLSNMFQALHLVNSETLSFAKRVAIETNAKVADYLGINRSAAITCVKPSGNSSVLADLPSPGVHPAFAKYYVRNVVIERDTPMTSFLLENNWPMIEHPYKDAYLAQFACNSGNCPTADEVSAFEHLNLWRVVQTNWSEHNASCTIYYNGEEVAGIKDWLYHNQDVVNGLSFLQRDNNDYPYSPIQKITEQEYNTFVQNEPVVDWDKFATYKVSEHTQKQVVECSGDEACHLGI